MLGWQANGTLAELCLSADIARPAVFNFELNTCTNDIPFTVHEIGICMLYSYSCFSIGLLFELVKR